MNIYDFDIPADTLEDGDQIVVNGTDYLEDIRVNDLGAAIKVEGYSHNSGDTAIYFLTPATTVALWAV